MNRDELDQAASDATFISRALHAFAGPVLAGQPPEVQSAALADLVAIWLAGHQGPGAEDLRAELFALFIGTVLDLVPVNEAMLRELRSDRQ